MTAKHTKAPWSVDLSAVFAESARIADIEQSGKSESENKANAKLIAAAPDLLEALIEVADCSAFGQLPRQTRDKVTALIEKAKRE